jgi:hypothetical protein
MRPDGPRCSATGTAMGTAALADKLRSIQADLVLHEDVCDGYVPTGTPELFLQAFQGRLARTL